MKCFVKIGSLILSVLLFFVGFGIIFGDNVNLLQICGRDCASIKAFVNIFGEKVAKFFLGFLWVFSGLFIVTITLKNWNRN